MIKNTRIEIKEHQIYNLFSVSPKTYPDLSINDKEYISFRVKSFVKTGGKFLEEKKCDLCEIPPKRKSLERLYSNVRSTLIKKIPKNIENKCIYCGIEPAYTLDHYMPKSKYPSLVVEINNLFWVCNSCNSKKKEFYKLDCGDRMFSHPVFDKNNVERFVCTICFKNDSISITHSKVLKLKDTYNNHIDNLALLKKYNSKATFAMQKKVRQDTEYILNHIYDKNTKLKELKIDYNDKLLNYGINYWETIFLKALLGVFDEYYAYLIKRISSC